MFFKIGVLSCEYCEIFINSFFYRTPLVTASDNQMTCFYIKCNIELKSVNKLVIL